MAEIDYDEEYDNTCPRCGGEGWIMAADGDGSDWGEDTYCGPLDAEIKCRECRGLGYFPRAHSRSKSFQPKE